MNTKKPYEFAAKDSLDKFPAPLLYIGWEDHKMFCAPFCVPVPPDMKFGDMVSNMLPGMFSAHPDFAKIDWSTVEWTKGGKPFSPDPAKSLTENGMRHKDSITFRTPGLTGIKGSST